MSDDYVDPEGIWLVEIRDKIGKPGFVEREVTVERFASGGLNICDDGIIRHYTDVKKWIRKVRALGLEEK
jgi:hypothetical protein